MNNLKLKQLSILLRVAGGIISFVLLTDSAKRNIDSFKEIRKYND